MFRANFNRMKLARAAQRMSASQPEFIIRFWRDSDLP
jgi:hypothetical protein